VRGLIFRFGLAIALLAALLVPAASASNGIETKTPEQIVAAAIAAGSAARSVHVSASLGQLSFDLDIVAGKGGKGRMVQNGLSFDLVRIGKNAYFRGSDKFWRKLGGTAAVQLFHGKWMRASATKGDLASLTPLTNLSALIRQSLGSHGKLAKGKTSTLHGQHVIAVKDVTQGGVLYVATDGQPYPIALSNANKHGTIYFDRWNASVSLSVPPNAIDITKLHTK
jgi:hypothetical protein